MVSQVNLIVSRFDPWVQEMFISEIIWIIVQFTIVVFDFYFTI